VTAADRSQVALKKAQFKPHRQNENEQSSPINDVQFLDFARRERYRLFSKKPSMLRLFFRFAFPVIVATATLFFGACEETAPAVPYLGGTYGAAAGPPRDTISYWDGDGMNGKPSIKISLGEQRAYFYKSGQLVGLSQLSTGREGLNTPKGQFSIIQKDKDHVSTKYGDFVDDAGTVVKGNVAISDPKPPGSHFKGAPMPYFMRIVGGVGMHAGYLPGYPASHGCIRMPEFMAENFFRSVSTGTPVTIAP
jgi:lipoprotein-anchoring transpeptidase ErfK/SrfK